MQERDPDLEPWVGPDAEAAAAEAAVRDATAPQGAPHGVPLGIKDDTDGLSFFTRCGSPIYRNDKPAGMWHMAKLRVEGAVIMGKTVTTEFTGRGHRASLADHGARDRGAARTAHPG
jgi:Asp-tRNA(Asn)/Glu-tRNA(Gln) amidotransferase A subunit family amidase